MTETTIQPVKESLDFTSATEFLEALNPLGNYVGTSKPHIPWLFRGQGVDRPLIPSALRERIDDNSQTPLELLVGKNLPAGRDRMDAELQLLLDFFEIADRRGLVLPGDSQTLRQTLWTVRDSKFHDLCERDLIKAAYGGSSHTNDEILSLIALAQHYGIPTRLLDWTPRVYVACYFAAESVLKRRNNNYCIPGLITVWAFHFPLWGRHNFVSQATDPFTIITAPSASNPNLAAQQGVFTLPYLYRSPSKSDYPPLDKILQEEADKICSARFDSKYDRHKLIAETVLRKFTLEESQAEELLYRLAKLDVTATSVYPGYASIKTELEMRNHWPT